MNSPPRNLKLKKNETLTLENHLPTEEPPTISEDILKFLENILHKTKEKQLNRNKHLETIPETQNKSNLPVYRGLNDNINNDFDNKNKARKGLLYLLNQLSGGNFCPEIVSYFEEYKLAKKNEKMLNDAGNQGNVPVKKPDHKNLRRQNFIENLDPKGSKLKQPLKAIKEDIKQFKYKHDKQDALANSNSNSKQLQYIFKKRPKESKVTDDSREEMSDNRPFSKLFLNDCPKEELKYFYTVKDIEDSHNKFSLSKERKIQKKLTQMQVNQADEGTLKSQMLKQKKKNKSKYMKTYIEGGFSVRKSLPQRMRTKESLKGNPHTRSVGNFRQSMNPTFASGKNFIKPISPLLSEEEELSEK